MSQMEALVMMEGDERKRLTLMTLGVQLLIVLQCVLLFASVVCAVVAPLAVGSGSSIVDRVFFPHRHVTCAGALPSVVV